MEEETLVEENAGQACVAFFWIDDHHGRVHPIVGCACHPWMGGPKYYKKAGRERHGEPALLASVSTPASQFLPYFLP